MSYKVFREDTKVKSRGKNMGYKGYELQVLKEGTKVKSRGKNMGYKG